jgi:ABC-type uncharacterized transport system permease subunit
MISGLAALIALLPAALLPWVRAPKRDAYFFASLAVAVLGPGLWTLIHMSGAWHTGLAGALWASLAAGLLLFVAISALSAQAWRLTPLLAPYFILIGLVASFWSQTPERPMIATTPSGWIILHILVSVMTYALCTLAAVAALAAFLQERALKRRNPTHLTRLLPSVADSESLTVKLLIASEVVLGAGLFSGMATQYMESGLLLRLDHKTLLSLLSFLVIGGLLAAHKLTGMRGRMAARLVLLGYLLLTLAYPGVKFVTDVLLSRPA